MPLNFDALLATTVTDQPFEYTERDTILYAIGVGFGSDPMSRRELPFVYEKPGLHTVPSMAAMLVAGDFFVNCGWDYNSVLHGGQHLDIYRPLPAAGKLLANRRISSIIDRGARKGVRIELESEVRLARDDTVLFTLRTILLARGDGGQNGPTGIVPLPHRLPKRDPDLSCDLPTRADQALLFRLSGDLNPLHADPDVAAAAGFPRPILHGRCTSGIACRAILQTICDYDFTLITGFEVRFTAPVFPGDIITTEMWQDRNVISFRCKVKERNVTVINNGRCMLRG